MMKRGLWLTVGLLVGSSTAHDEQHQQQQCEVTDDGTSTCSTTKQSLSSFQCGIYLAPSTIPGAGLGIFSGIERQEGDTVGDGDILLPIADVWWHLQASNDYNDYDGAPNTLDPTTDYVWHGPEMGMQQESSDAQRYVTAFAPGLDAAINCNLALINVDKDVPVYDTAGLHRSKDPGAGAISPYHNCSTTILAHVPAGGELFKYYGDNWFITREQVLGQVPFRENFPRAEELIKAFGRKVGPELFSQELRSDAYNLMTQFALPSRTIKALPNNLSHSQTVAEGGIRAFYQQSAVRTIDELERTGRCIDTIYPGPSTIRQAGRGAFAKMAFAADEIITATPLLFTHSSDFFMQYHGDWDDLEESEPDTSRFRGYSLVMNYCWNHHSADLFLCPYGYEVNYINHNQTRANVKMQWASDGMMGHKGHFLQLSPDAMGDRASPGLIMDFVATRDISPGEELFMDYGNAWEEAWRKYELAFAEQSHQFADYVSAREWNELHVNVILRTKAEQASAPYPPNMQLHCLDEDDNIVMNAEISKSYWTIDNSGLPCQIASRRVDAEGDVFYKVWYEHKQKDDSGAIVIEREWHEAEWLVREAIRMVDKPYMADHWLKGAFRYPVGIPDDVFPVGWRGFGL